MKESLHGFEQVRILVAGDLMLDRYWSGDTGRISPEAPVPVVKVNHSQECPGGAANVALNIAALGSDTVVLGVIGADEAGELLERNLNQVAGISTALSIDKHVTTITKLRVLSRHQQLIRLDFEVPFPATIAPQLVEPFTRHLAECDVVILSDYGKGTLADPQTLIAAAQAAGKPVLVDPKRLDYSAYAGASLITPNMGEFEAVVGSCATDDELVTKGRKLMGAHNIGGLLITRSEKGMSLLQRDAEPLHIPAQAREVFDVTGAGDTVIATLAASIAAGLSLNDAARLANIAAGIVVGKLGAATVSMAELRRALHELDNTHRGIMDETRLLEIVADARAHGERIVMTNGCFDILHAGHVQYLEQARQLGDRLIVAVNSDNSVKQLKGPKRPVNPLSARMNVLAGLSSVDWVVPFEEATPERLICAIKPDVLVKGGDYQPEQVAGHQCAGEMRILPFVDGCSTTSIIDAIHRQAND